MNQLYRALHMPPQRLLKKLTGHKEIYTIAVRPAPVAEGCDLLPALGAGAFLPQAAAARLAELGYPPEEDAVMLSREIGADGRGSIRRGALAAVVGSVVYRFIYAIVLKTKIVPIDCLKLVTAIIVGLAIAMPTLKSGWAFQKRKLAARNGKGE